MLLVVLYGNDVFLILVLSTIVRRKKVHDQKYVFLLLAMFQLKSSTLDF